MLWRAQASLRWSGKLWRPLTLAGPFFGHGSRGMRGGEYRGRSMLLACWETDTSKSVAQTIRGVAVGRCESPFCRAPEGDLQEHYVACPVLSWLLQRRAGLHRQPDDAAMHAWLLTRADAPDSAGIVAVVAIDVVVSAFDSHRGGSGSLPRAGLVMSSL